MTLSDRLFLMLPALIAVGLLLLSAMPVQLGWLALTPNIAWLATILMVRLAPAAWPAWVAWLVGLLQDMLFATPLGSQATIAVLLLLAMRARPARIGAPLLRDLWAEAAVLLMAGQWLLWLALQWIQPAPPPLVPLVLAALANLIWFPLLAWIAERLASRLYR